jgi:hypothetical protein
VVSELPEDDLYQDVLFDSAKCDMGFVKGLRLECTAVGLDLGSSTDSLRLIGVTFAMSQWHVAQEAGASISEDPRSCPSFGEHHARTSGCFDMVPRKSMCLVAVCMAMPVLPLEHISCCVFVWVAVACLVLWAGVLGFRDILDTVRCAVRESGMRNIWFLSVLLEVMIAHPAPLPAWLYNVVVYDQG